MGHSEGEGFRYTQALTDAPVLTSAQAHAFQEEVRTQRSSEGKGLPLDAAAVAWRVRVLRRRVPTLRTSRVAKKRLDDLEATLPQNIKDLLDKNKAELKEDVAASEKRTFANMEILQERIDDNEAGNRAEHTKTAKAQKKHEEETRAEMAKLAEELRTNKADSDAKFTELVTGMAQRDAEREGKQDEWIKHQPPPQKRPRKAKEPETPETLEKKKLQKELDAAKRKVTNATATMEQDREAEDILKQGCDAGRSAKPALTAATKKRENSEKKLKNLQDDVADREAKFALKYPA